MLSLLQRSHEACWCVGLGVHCLILARRGHGHARRRGKGVPVEGESNGQTSEYGITCPLSNRLVKVAIGSANVLLRWSPAVSPLVPLLAGQPAE